jgi:hypothetical protein
VTLAGISCAAGLAGRDSSSRLATRAVKPGRILTRVVRFTLPTFERLAGTGRLTLWTDLPHGV